MGKRTQELYENVGTKTCNKCKRTFERSLNYFFKKKNVPDGLVSTCKECRGHKFLLKVTEGNKVCFGCKETFPSTEEHFTKNIRKKDGLESYCKICRQQDQKQYYAQFKEVIDERHRDYYESNKEKHSVRAKRYRIENRDKISIYWHSKEAVKRKLPKTFTAKQWRECQDHFDNVCSYCGNVTEVMTQDHFVPIKLGGEYTHNNIIPACRTCNSKKQYFDFFIWYPKQKFYSKKRESKILKYLNYKQNTQQLTLTL